MFDFLGNWLYQAVTFIYNNVAHNYVLTIVLATLVLKLIMIPADISQRKSSFKMAGAQDDIKRIQKKYANDQAKIQQKTMEYYKKHGISPYASCLPLLITMPLFIAFFNGLRLWQNELTLNLLQQVQSGVDPAVALKPYEFLWIRNIWQPDSGLATIVMKAEEFVKIPFDKLFMFDEATRAGFKALGAEGYTAVMKPLLDSPTNNGWFIMPLLAGASMLIQTAITNKNNPTAAGGPGTNKIMTYGFAALSVWICITNNAAFAIYWMVSNVCAVIMQLILNKVFKKNSSPVHEEAEKNE